MYALCHPYKTSDMHIKINTAIKLTGRLRNRYPDNNPSLCSHIYHYLHPFAYRQYLDPEYVQRKIDEKNALLPTKCTLCSMKIIPIKNDNLLLIMIQNTKKMITLCNNFSLIAVFCI